MDNIQHQQEIRNTKSVLYLKEDMEIFRKKLLAVESSSHSRENQCRGRKKKCKNGIFFFPPPYICGIFSTIPPLGYKEKTKNGK
jgi:hypothetical protein